MKTQIFTIIFSVIILTSFSQNKQSYYHITDSLCQINIQNQTYLDTIWVLDSSLLYGYPGGVNELMLERKYEVLKRNDFGNVLVALNKVPEWMEPFFLNTEYDSIIYFNGTDIKKHYTNAWNSVEQIWIENEYLEYESPDLLKEEFDKKFSNGMQQYSYGYRKVYHNSSNRLDTMYQYHYNPEMNSWDNYLRTNYNYFESGLIFEEITQQFEEEDTSWNNYYKTIYTYNEDNSKGIVELKVWDTENNNWRENYISYFTYDASGRLTNRLQLQYSIGLQEMINLNNYIWEYKENKTTQTSQNWHMPDGPWENQYRAYFSNITEYKMDTLRQDLWDNLSEIWEQQYLSVNQYDNHQNVFEEATYNAYGGGVWNLDTRTDFYWSPFMPNAIQETKDKPITAYPNPATTTVTFSADKLPQNSNVFISIYNITGQKVANVTNANNELKWDCSNMETGLYIYSIEDTGNRYTGKIIVR